MKNRLYYENAMMKQFEATVIKTEIDSENKPFVVLSNTAFYPTGGGQPHDTGTINGVNVINVEEIDDEIRHYIESKDDFSRLNGTVEGVLNWARRFDHMQQHTGQHILTAAFVELFDFPTLSFHLGSETVTIDLETNAVTDEQLLAAEKRANEIVLENHSIITKWTTVEEANTYPLRKALKVEGDVRLVIIPDFDYNGCGGTHPTSTGQVQAIKILATEKMKQNIRIHFVCGQRVLDALHQQNTVLTNVAKQLSVPKDEAFTALQKVMTAAKANEKLLLEAQDSLLTFEAARLVSEASDDTIIAVLENKSMQQLQKMAKQLATNASFKIALIAQADQKYQIVLACGNAGEISMKSVIQTILPAINGRGGGGDQLAQGGGDAIIPIDELIAMIQKQFN